MSGDVPRPMAAVIEIGSTSIRMAIARRQPGGYDRSDNVNLDLPIAIGRESFTGQAITPATTERCVAAIRRFQRVLQEHSVPVCDLRVVATSAVREARNREMFVDRILIATGLRVEVLDEVEVSRLTYLAVRPLLRRQAFFRTSSTLVVEVGGGGTEILAFRKGRVGAAHVYRLGSLRMFEELGESTRAPGGGELLGDYLAAPVSQMASDLALAAPVHAVALGGEARQVRDALGVARSPDGLDVLDVRQARAFLQKHLREPVSLLARRFDLSEHQAETLLPSLAVYLALADAVGARRLHVGDATLRDGILTEMFGGREWEGEFRRQTVNSALALARRYHVDRRHCGQVAQYAGRLYDFVGRHVALEPADAILLQVAALLHEIGMFVNSRSHHKHTLYLIENSDIFGLGARDIALVARIARYHRRAMPQPTHEEFTTLAPEDRVRLEKLAAILRVADALACLRETEAVPLEFRLRRDELEILAWTTDDLTLAQRQLASRAEMFETVYGWRVTLGRGRALEQSHAGA